ncbi:MAG: class A beta-lactamase-related serine hydrolase [Cyanobacteria bacterium]|nr:class A beta-lactamase-related serine hydrolase [Cyanobacteriota bacterium]
MTEFQPFSTVSASQSRRASGYERYRAQRRKQAIQFVGLCGVLTAITIFGGLMLLFSGPSAQSAPQENPSREDLAQSNLNYEAVNTPLLGDIEHQLNYFHRTMMPVKAPTRLIPLSLTQEDNALKTRLLQVVQSFEPRFKTHLFYYNPQTGEYVNIGGDQPVAAASMIKVPVLFQYLRNLDEGRISVTTPIHFLDEDRASGAGDLQYQAAGQIFPSHHVATEMIQASDNTCTNLMMTYMGGREWVRQNLQDLGLQHTEINNILPDLEGTNTISMREMVTLLNNIDHGPLLSPTSRQLGLTILTGTHNKRLLPAVLPADVVIAHKTGDIGTALGDVGLIYLPNGKRYAIAVQVDRPYNDYTARTIIQEAARLVYEKNS